VSLAALALLDSQSNLRECKWVAPEDPAPELSPFIWRKTLLVAKAHEEHEMRQIGEDRQTTCREE